MVTYVLESPMIITARLMPGVKIGDVTISVEPVIWDGAGFACAYYIDGPDGEMYAAQDLHTGAGVIRQADAPRFAMEILLSFLGAEADRYYGHSVGVDGEWSFNEAVAEWAHRYDDEISALEMELAGQSEDDE